MLTLLLTIAAATGWGTYLKVRWKERYQPQLPPAADEDDVINYLIASSEISPLASRLLNEAECLKAERPRLVLNPAPPPPKKPLWHHTNSSSTPPEELWKMILEDVQAEESDSYRLKSVANWNDAETFTTYERAQLLKLFKNAAYRDAARDILLGKKKLVAKRPKPKPVPPRNAMEPPRPPAPNREPG